MDESVMKLDIRVSEQETSTGYCKSKGNPGCIVCIHGRSRAACGWAQLSRIMMLKRILYLKTWRSAYDCSIREIQKLHTLHAFGRLQMLSTSLLTCIV